MAEAAQKRAARALERLRTIFAERGVAVPMTGLATPLSPQAIQSAPVGLAASVIAAGTAETITSATSTIGLIMASTKIKIGLAAALIAAASIPLAIQHQPRRACSARSKSSGNKARSWLDCVRNCGG